MSTDLYSDGYWNFKLLFYSFLHPLGLKHLEDLLFKIAFKKNNALTTPVSFEPHVGLFKHVCVCVFTSYPTDEAAKLREVF